jgi:DNA-binding PadR family transcriptional regulator
MTPAQIRRITDRRERDCGNRGRSIGANEALILTVLQPLDALSVADVALRLEKAELGRSIDDGSIYLALYRMSQRGFVSVVKRSVISADGRRRKIGFYAIMEAGQKAVSQSEADSRAVIRIQEIGGK